MGEAFPVPCAEDIVDGCRDTWWRRSGQSLEWLCPPLAVPIRKAFRIHPPPERPIAAWRRGWARWPSPIGTVSRSMIGRPRPPGEPCRPLRRRDRWQRAPEPACLGLRMPACRGSGEQEVGSGQGFRRHTQQRDGVSGVFGFTQAKSDLCVNFSVPAREHWMSQGRGSCPGPRSCRAGNAPGGRPPVSGRVCPRALDTPRGPPRRDVSRGTLEARRWSCPDPTTGTP